MRKLLTLFAALVGLLMLATSAVHAGDYPGYFSRSSSYYCAPSIQYRGTRSYQCGPFGCYPTTTWRPTVTYNCRPLRNHDPVIRISPIEQRPSIVPGRSLYGF